MKPCIALLAALLFTLSPLIGQNADAVKAYLGAYRYDNVAPPSGPVEFVFSRTTLSRQADGKATYKSLLKSGYFQDSGNYGSLSGVRITENGKLVPVERYTPAVDPSGTLTRADVGSSALKVPTLPDSATIRDALNSARRGVETTSKTIAPAVGEVWAFWMWLFNGYLLPWLISFGSFFLLIAMISAKESLISRFGIVAGRAFVYAHQWSSAGLACILSVIALTFLASIDLWLWKTTGSNLVLAMGAVGSAWIEYQIICKLIPNLPVAGTKSGAKYTGGGNNPMLNG